MEGSGWYAYNMLFGKDFAPSFGRIYEDEEQMVSS